MNQQIRARFETCLRSYSLPGVLQHNTTGVGRKGPPSQTNTLHSQKHSIVVSNVAHDLLVVWLMESSWSSAGARTRNHL